MREAPDHLFHGRARIRAVCKHNVHVLQLQALERGHHPLQQVLPGETTLVLTGSSPEELGGNHIVSAVPANLLQRVSHDRLSLTGLEAVRLSVVEEVDPVLKGNTHAISARLIKERKKERKKEEEERKRRKKERKKIERKEERRRKKKTKDR